MWLTLSNWLNHKKKTPEKWAKLRWKTISNSIKSLRASKNGVQILVSSSSNSELCKALGNREDSCSNFINVMMDSKFWAQLELVDYFCEPMFHLSGWIRGCSFCESKPKKDEIVNWSRRGLRAPELRKKNQATEGTLHAKRETVSSLRFFTNQVLCIAVILLKTIASLHQKFSYLSCCPFLIWSAIQPGSNDRDKDGMHEFICEADCMVSSGQLLDTVTKMFARKQLGSLAK